MKNLRRVLIVRNDRMGDLLMTLPAVQQIRQGFPGCRVTLLIRRELESLLNDHPSCDQILGWDPAQGQGWGAALRWAARFRNESFDAAVIFNPTRCFHIAAALAGIPIRIGYRRKWGFLLSHSIPDTKAGRSLHEAQYNLELLPLLGLTPSPPILDWPAQADAAEKTNRFFQEAGLAPSTSPVALHPWTSNTEKSWPSERFRDLAQRLAGARHPLILLGGPEESAGWELWKSGFPPSAVDWVGKLPLDLLPSVLRRCALLISNDSGPVHVAAAVGTRTLIVAPREHAAQLTRWKPLGSSHHILLSPSVEEVLLETQKALAACGS